MTVGCDECVLRLNSRAHGGHVGQQHRSVVDRSNDDAVQLFGLFCLAANQGKFKLMIFFDQSGRFNDVRVADRVNDLLGRNTVSDETIGRDRHMKLSDLAAGYSYGRDAGQTSKPGTNDVVCDVSQTRRVASIGSEAVTNDGKYREGQALDVANLGRGRKCRREL